MKVFSLICGFLFISSLELDAQDSSLVRSNSSSQPKLLVGIVVDQMRYDYLLRFKEHFGEGGFNRLMSEGLNCVNTNYNYKPTYTAPGHASIFTGSTPSVHGIVGNAWYSREAGENIYCVRIDQKAGEDIYSPQRMEVNTLADVIKLSNPASKSYGASLKDRGAILPAGHMADGAYWFEGEQGGFVSSAYYSNSKKDWVREFNEKDVYDTYLKNGWKLSEKENIYDHLEDARMIERPYEKGKEAIFPYDFEKVYKDKGADLIKATPYGNELLKDFAMELVVNEELGKDGHLDFLSISFSSTDYIGHQFGVMSREVMDCYIKLDRDLAELLNFLEEQTGGEYVVFLTADHGAAVNREELKSKGIPSGYLDIKEIRDALDKHLDSLIGAEEWVESTSNLNIYFDRSLFQNHDRNEVLELSYHFLKRQEGIANVYLPGFPDPEDHLIPMAARGYHSDESGDLVIIEKPNWNSFWKLGSGHESPYKYDTHVPLLIYGRGLKSGSDTEAYSITDIIPSLAIYLRLGMPDGVRDFKTISLEQE